ncbi:MAG: lauroyl/myristoyl acyltransferase [Candidatus Poriferisodalaceae bacterium]|jgi:lauroyl/myristoyl acyltransferase
MADRMWAETYRLGSRLARTLPGPMAERIPDLVGSMLASSMPAKRRMMERHLRRVLGPGASERTIRRTSRKAFESYARYWLESFRLPDKTPDDLRRGIDVPNYHHVEKGLDAGKGVILALPHLGGWEWAGFWMAAANKVPITVVVEAIEPPELFEWFTSFRESLGMHVVPLGPDAGTEIITALKRNEVVCLLSDRDIGGGGIEVDFFGETTTLPGGPALLGLRTGAPVLPTGVYFSGQGRHLGVVQPPLDTSRHGKLRADVSRVSQELADALEGLIRRAPEQWHLFQPNWPSDHKWLARQN